MNFAKRGMLRSFKPRRVTAPMLHESMEQSVKQDYLNFAKGIFPMAEAEMTSKPNPRLWQKALEKVKGDDHKEGLVKGMNPKRLSPADIDMLKDILGEELQEAMKPIGGSLAKETTGYKVGDETFLPLKDLKRVGIEAKKGVTFKDKNGEWKLTQEDDYPIGRPGFWVKKTK